ncbi:MAG: glycosyltransferase [Thermoguttaceae bacterium]|jgi:glycosyltransferase involved in cell wall biosynthesis
MIVDVEKARTDIPLVTAIVGCYNHERYVQETLDSVLAQTYPNIQLVVFDDCSRDGSVATIRDWIDRHNVVCTLLAHSKNVGICASLNDALLHARGKYITMVAADDVWLSEKTAKQVEIMESLSEDVGVLYSDAYRINESGELLPQTFIPFYRTLSTMPEGRIFDTLIKGNFIPAMTALIRRECYQSVGGYDESLFFEDWDMWARISRVFQFAFCPFLCAKYRVVGTSMSHSQRDKMDVAMDAMFAKYFLAGWLEGNFRKHGLDGLECHLWRSFRTGMSVPWHSLLLLVRNRPSRRNLALLVWVCLRLRRADFESALKLFGSIRKWSGLTKL